MLSPSMPLSRAGRGLVFAVLAIALHPALLPPSATTAAELSADQLVLVVNRNVPEGRELAEFYARSREIPEGRIVELDLPDVDRLPRETYETEVVPKLRDFVGEFGENQVRCLVTFYGVPLAVGAKQLSDAEKAERAKIDLEAEEALTAITPAVDRAVATARALQRRVPDDLPFGTPLQKALSRLELAEQQIRAGVGGLSESERTSVASTASAIRAMLVESSTSVDVPLSDEERQELAELLADDLTSEQRERARELARRDSILTAARVLARQQQFLESGQTTASLDSELATLLYPQVPLARWLGNPLQGNLRFDRSGPRPLMVARLDGSSPQKVRDLIADTLLAERDGLTGTIVVDSRGLQMPGANGKPDGYAPFDEQLRQLAGFLQRHATLPVVHDDRSDIIRGTAEKPAVEGVAVYVGWYRLRNYEPAFTFARGAVAVHVASLELKSLDDPNERGWAKGLLDAGAVATAGAVDEPYLSAFPPPAAFFPLLLAGELTLAEVYWATVPQVSWQLSLIGDPLYRPFAVEPAVPVEALPPGLQNLVKSGAEGSTPTGATGNQ